MNNKFELEISEGSVGDALNKVGQSVLSAPTDLGDTPSLLMDAATDAVSKEVLSLINDSGVMQQIGDAVSSATEIIKTAKDFLKAAEIAGTAEAIAEHAISIIPNYDSNVTCIPSPKDCFNVAAASLKTILMAKFYEALEQLTSYYNKLIVTGNDAVLDNISLSVDSILGEIAPLLDDIMKEKTGYTVSDIRYKCSKGFQLVATLKRYAETSGSAQNFKKKQQEKLQAQYDNIKQNVKAKKEELKSKAKEKADLLKEKAQQFGASTKNMMIAIGDQAKQQFTEEKDQLQEMALNKWANMQRDFSEDSVKSKLKNWLETQNVILLNAFSIVIIKDTVQDIQVQMQKLQSTSNDRLGDFIGVLESIVKLFEQLGVTEDGKGLTEQDFTAVFDILKNMPDTLVTQLQNTVKSVSESAVNKVVSTATDITNDLKNVLLNKSVLSTSIASVQNSVDSAKSVIENASLLPEMLSTRVLESIKQNTDLSKLLEPLSGKSLIYDPVLQAMKTLLPVLDILKKIIKLQQNYRINHEYAEKMALDTMLAEAKKLYSALGLDKNIDLSEYNIFAIRTTDLLNNIKNLFTDNIIQGKQIILSKEETEKFVSYVETNGIYSLTSLKTGLETVLLVQADDTYKDGEFTGMPLALSNNNVFYSDSGLPLVSSEILLNKDKPAKASENNRFDDLLDMITVKSDEFEGTQSIELSSMNLCSPVNEYAKDPEPSDKKCVILEFGTEYLKGKEYVYQISVKPGDNITEETVIGYMGEEQKPLKSMFSKGVVKESNGDYFHVDDYSKRHIVIEDVEMSLGTDYSSDRVQEMADKMSQANQLFQLLLNSMPYSCYPFILALRRPGPVPDSAAKFQGWIDRYTNYVESQTELLLQKAGEDGIKGTSGNPYKMKLLSEEILQIREDMLSSVISFYKDDLPNISCVGMPDYMDCALLAFNKSQPVFDFKVGDISYGNYYIGLLSNIDLSQKSEWNLRYYDLISDIAYRRIQTESYSIDGIVNEFNKLYRMNIDITEKNPWNLLKDTFTGDINWQDVYDFIKKKIIYIKSSVSAKASYSELKPEEIELWYNTEEVKLVQTGNNDNLYGICKQLANMFLYVKTAYVKYQVAPEERYTLELLLAVFNNAVRDNFTISSNEPFNIVLAAYNNIVHNSEAANIDMLFTNWLSDRCQNPQAADKIKSLFYDIRRKQLDNSYLITSETKEFINNVLAFELVKDERSKIQKFWDDAIDALKTTYSMSDVISELKEYAGSMTNNAKWPEPSTIKINGQLYDHYLFLNCETTDKGSIDDLEIPVPPETVTPPEKPEINTELLNEELKQLKDNEITIFDYEYWLVYMTNATLLTLIPIYWADGFDIPPFQTPLKLPGIYVPIAPPLYIKPIKALVVFGIGIRGIWPMPIILILNLGSNDLDVMFPVQLATELLKLGYLAGAQALENPVGNMVKDMLNSLLEGNAVMKNTIDRYRTYGSLIKGIPLENKALIENRFKEALHGKIDTRHVITRLDNLEKGPDPM